MSAAFQPSEPPDGAGVPFTARLAFQIGVGLCTGAALILVAAGIWNLRLQRAQLTRLVGLSADRMAETIRGSTRDAMLRNDRDGLLRTIENIGALQGIHRVRVFDKEGSIRVSSRPDEVGRKVDIAAEECHGCHQDGRPKDGLMRAERVRILRDPEGGRVLGVIAPIRNEPQCTTACHAHPPSQKLLGVLDVQLSMAAVDDALRASEHQLLLGLGVAVAAVLVLAGALVWRRVLRPVGRLTAAISHLATGQQGHALPVTSRDEIGLMTASWNTLTAELRRAREALEEMNRDLERRVAEKATELERAHNQMLLVEKMASLGKLAAVVAHEINNPLAGIRTYARLLRRREAEDNQTPNAEAARILRVIDEEAGRCGDIVRNLLLFSRSSDATFADEDLAPVLERCRVLLRHQAEMLSVDLTLELQEDLPRVTCDASQIEQMVLALVLNGLEATSSGGRVSIAARKDGDIGVRIEVSDDGSGIAPDVRERMFEPFFTTKEHGKGVGLGLAVVYGIVERHRGRIEVDSRVGGGTVFTIRLPVQPPAPTPEVT